MRRAYPLTTPASGTGLAVRAFRLNGIDAIEAIDTLSVFGILNSRFHAIETPENKKTTAMRRASQIDEKRATLRCAASL
jgi:hypothetical protein